MVKGSGPMQPMKAKGSKKSKGGPGEGRKVRKQAPVLSKALWLRWLLYLQQEAGARICFAVWLTGEFGLRMGEALALARSDLKTEADPPYVDVKGVIKGARKSPGKVFIRPGSLKQLRKWLQDGIPEMGGPVKDQEPKAKGPLARNPKAKGLKAKGSDKAKGPNKAKGQKKGVWTLPREGFLF